MTESNIKLGLALLAGLAVGYHLAKRKATNAATHNDTTGQSEQWWSYAGSWSF